MSEHKYIWLQPECCADPDEGRHWCQDPDPVECDDGKLWTKYILASEYEALERQLAEVRQSLQRAEGERDEARELLTKLVKEADEGNPFCAVGHFVEHVIPEARKFTNKPEKQSDDAALKDRMLYVGGSNRSFRCECGCNVFKEYKPNRYRCNSCKETYTGEPPTKGATHEPNH